jgi:hypothetical protein
MDARVRDISRKSNLSSLAKLGYTTVFLANEKKF